MRYPALQLVNDLTAALAKPKTGSGILSIGQLGDSDGKPPAHTVWAFAPDEAARVWSALRRTFP